MCTVYLAPGFNRLDENVSVPAGTAVKIAVPSGYYWRGRADGIEVLPRWWRRALNWLGFRPY